MANQKPLTRRQAEALGFIKTFIASKGYSPSVREVAEHMRYSSSSTPFNLMEQLVKKGYIKKGSGPRMVQVLKRKEI